MEGDVTTSFDFLKMRRVYDTTHPLHLMLGQLLPRLVFFFFFEPAHWEILQTSQAYELYSMNTLFTIS